MKPTLFFAWIFLAGAMITVAFIPILYVRGFNEDVILYLKSAGIVYAAPLGIAIAAAFGAKPPLVTMDRSMVFFAYTAAVFWSGIPVALGAYATFAYNPTFFQTFCQHLQEATIPVNAAITALLTSLFRKDSAENAASAQPNTAADAQADG